MFPVPQYCLCSPVPLKILPLFPCSPEINDIVPLFPKTPGRASFYNLDNVDNVVDDPSHVSVTEFTGSVAEHPVLIFLKIPSGFPCFSAILFMVLCGKATRIVNQGS